MENQNIKLIGNLECQFQLSPAKFCEYCGESIETTQEPMIDFPTNIRQNVAKIQAEQMGYATLRLTSLHAMPRNVHVDFFPRGLDQVKSLNMNRVVSSVTPDIMDEIRDYITLLDPSLIQYNTLGATFLPNIKLSYCSPKLQLYIEATDKYMRECEAFAWAHIVEIDIFCDNEEYIRVIAQAVNNLWENGVIANMSWFTFIDMFDIEKDDAIAAWKKWL